MSNFGSLTNYRGAQPAVLANSERTFPNAVGKAPNSVALPEDSAVASNEGALAIGTDAVASGVTSLAIGYGSSATVEDGLALGAGAQATSAARSVAIVCNASSLAAGSPGAADYALQCTINGANYLIHLSQESPAE